MISTARAHRSAIAQKILDILKTTAEDYKDNGETGTDLRDAPEYLLCVDIAKGLTRAFGKLRYRLEQPAGKFAESSRKDVDISDALGKELARFDIVLIDRRSGAPRYIIEVKRGHKVIGDARRVIGVAALEHERKRWRHAFLVTILRRSEQDAMDIATKLKAEMQLASTYPDSARLANSSVDVVTHLERVGESREPGTAIYAVVFRLSLKVKNGDADPIA